jgi:NAD(P)-dependent dehydrogenase (short-subunit alcohol dehydrogenase family)
MTHKNIAIIGSSGAIGSQLVEQLHKSYPLATIHAFSRIKNKENTDHITYYALDYSSEANIQEAADNAAQLDPLDLVVITTGTLHKNDIMPEKSIQDLSKENLTYIYYVNTILPSLIGKYFLPKFDKQAPGIFSALSARVGSICDNKLGGWYSYRASKAALNMIMKNFSIEMKRTHKNLIIAGLHPGTVDSNLSAPFQSRVPKDKLFSPTFSAQSLIAVLNKLTIVDSGKCFAWDGKEIEP